MRKVWSIFTRDLKRLSRNVIAMVVIAGICVIPSLYAWFNIYANMDPYANTGNIRIAVVNLDAGTEDERVGHLDAGVSVEEKLRDNSQLGWVFTDEETAVEGVKAGEYYAAVVIPETFSADLASVFTADIRQPAITFYSNEKKNAIAPKITGSGVSALQQGINDEFVATLSETMTGILSEKLGQAEGSLDRSMEDLRASILTVSDLTAQLQDLLEDFHTLKTETDRVTADGREGLAEADDTLKKAADTAQKLETTVSRDRKQFRAYSDDLRAGITDAGHRLSDLNRSAGEDLGALNSLIQALDTELNRRAEPIVSRAETIQQRSRELLDVLSDLTDALPDDRGVRTMLQDLKEDNDRHRQLLLLLQSAAAGARGMHNASSGMYSAVTEGITGGQTALESALERVSAAATDRIGASLDEAAAASAHLRGGLETAQEDLTLLSSLLDRISGVLEDTDKAVTETQKAVERIQEQMDEAVTDLDAIESLQIYTELKDAADTLDSERVSHFLASPVTMDTEILYPIANYGTGMTPFYTNLAIWVGCVVLVNIFKMEVDQDEKIRDLKPREVYFGRWLLFVITALIQAFIVCLGDLLLLGVQCERPGLFVLCGLWTSFVFMNIVYALAVTFKHIGKALCVLLVILQIPGSSGTYPIEMTPQFFQNLHPFLPFTYGVGAMREAIAGVYGNHYAWNMAMLLLFLPVSLAIGLLLRPMMLNLNHLFDRRLAETDLMACEKNGLVRERMNLTLAARALFADDAMRERLRVRIDRFEGRYQKIVRRAFLLVALIPVVFLALMFLIPEKLGFLILWIVSILAVILFLLIVEYLREHLDRERRMMEMTPEELTEQVKRSRTDRKEA